MPRAALRDGLQRLGAEAGDKAKARAIGRVDLVARFERVVLQAQAADVEQHGLCVVIVHGRPSRRGEVAAWSARAGAHRGPAAGSHSAHTPNWYRATHNR